MHRALIKILVALSLALGLGLTTASTSQAATAEPAGTTAAPAEGCTDQANAVAVARRTYNRQKAQRNRATAAYNRAVRAENRAQTKSARRTAHGKTVRAKNRVTRERRDVRVSATRLRNKRAALRSCQDNQPTTSPTSSPIQTLCDAGLPQDVCDGLAELLPLGGTTDSPLSLLCSAVADAQPLCDLLSTGTAPDPQDLLDTLEGVLNDTGLIDLISGLLGGLGLGALLDSTELDTLLDLLGLGSLV